MKYRRICKYDFIAGEEGQPRLLRRGQVTRKEITVTDPDGTKRVMEARVRVYPSLQELIPETDRRK